MSAETTGLQKLDGIQKTTAATQSWREYACFYIYKKKKVILFSDNDPKVTLFPGNDPEPHVSAICWATMKEQRIAVMSDGSQRKDLGTMLMLESGHWLFCR